MENSIFVSVVVPVHNEEQSLPELTNRIVAAFHLIEFKDSFEVIFVNDGSSDRSGKVIRQLCNEYVQVKAVVFKTNKGKSLALMAGFYVAKGDYIITMDADLQDNPEDIPALIKKLEEGHDLVSGWRKKREDSRIRVIGSLIFNWAIRKTTGLDIHDANCGFKIMRKEVTERIVIIGHAHRYIPVLAYQNGLKIAEIPVVNSKRKYGASQYTTFRFQGLFDLMTILFLNKHGFSPLHLFGTISLLLIIPSSLVLLYLTGGHILFWFGYGKELFNRPLLILSVVAFLAGINIFLTGFVCDFILYHLIDRSIEEKINKNIDEIY